MARKVDIRFSASMEIDKLMQSLSDVKKGMADVKIPANVAKGLNNALSDAEYSMKELQKMGEQPIMTRSALKQFNKVYKQATEDYKNVFRYINQLQNADVKFNAKESLGKQYKYYQLIEQTIKKITDSQKKTTENYQERERALEKYKTELSEIKKIQDKLTKADENSKKAKLDLQNAQDKYNSSLVRNGPGPESDRIAKLRDKINDAEKESEAAENTLNRIQEQAKEKTGGESIESVITRLSAAVEQGQKSLDSISNGTAGFVEQLNNLKRATEEDSGLKDFFDNQELTGLQNGLEDITNLSDLKDLMVAVRQNAEELAQVDFSNMTESLPQVEHSLDNIEEEADRTNIQVRELIDTTEDFGKVGQRALDFFALSNLGNIFGQIVSDAKKAISDLDEVMTATAVVTNFSVGDMWDKLPEYTRLANELGASTLGAYETTTLFYQQGLNNNQAMEIGAETMRMARIAGLDYAKATDYMTASLRGFNMELSAESAEHINDVFSNLAAKTASNQQEMAEALTKTASIANSAGMSFETTSVLLAKMIETTRESPENLGTALKTVIGRFAEMKKATSDLITTEDGEVISVNRVDSALKSVGIQLKDTSGKFRSLDDVFLELSQRWDTLDIMSQRYIATQAAGSRQQSRFIAMMENYTRTQELLGYAYNSSGAAAEQFNKTMESMEAKMARLNNSWNTFVTGIVNASALKTGVDLLNGILTVINDITNVMPGALNGISKMLLGFLGIRTIKPLLTGVLFDVNKFIQESIAGKGASEFSKGLKAGFTGLRNTVFNRETWYKSGLEAGAAAADGIQTSIQSPAWVSAQSKSGQKLIQRFLNLDGTEDASKVINKLGKSFNATEEQITLFNQAIENGVPKEDALLILRNKEVVSNYTAANSTGVFNAAVLANTIAEEENTIATASATRAKELENAAEKNGILQKGAALVKILFMSKAKREEAAVTLGLAHAEGDAAVATGALGKGLMALPLGTVALGLTTILVAFHALNKNLHSAEWEKVENAKKTLESVDARQEESDKIKELNSSYENARDSYNDTTKAKREYINATQELAQAIGAEIKANDLLSGNTKKINTQIKKGQTERTRNSIKQIETEIEAAQTLIKNGEYVKRTYGGQFFLGDFSRTLWGRQSYAEADEQVTQGQESLEKSKADLKEEQIQLALLQAQSKNNINIAATSYSQFAAFKTDFTNQLTEFGLTQNEIASSLRQILTDSEVEFNLINEAERQFTERLAKSEIGIDKTELEEFYKSIRDEDINTLEYVSLVGVNDINDLKKQYDNAKTLYDSYKKINFGKSITTATDALLSGKGIDSLSTSLKKNFNIELSKTRGIYNDILTAQEEWNKLVKENATQQAQTLYLLKLDEQSIKDRLESQKLLAEKREKTNEIYSNQQEGINKKSATVQKLSPSQELINVVSQVSKLPENLSENLQYQEDKLKRVQNNRLSDKQDLKIAKNDANTAKAAIRNWYNYVTGITPSNEENKYNAARLWYGGLGSAAEEVNAIFGKMESLESFSSERLELALAGIQQFTKADLGYVNETDLSEKERELYNSIKILAPKAEELIKTQLSLNHAIESNSELLTKVNSSEEELALALRQVDIKTLRREIFSSKAQSIVVSAENIIANGEKINLSESADLYNILSESQPINTKYSSALEEWQYDVQYSSNETQKEFLKKIEAMTHETVTAFQNNLIADDLKAKQAASDFLQEQDESFGTFKNSKEYEDIADKLSLPVNNIKTYKDFAEQTVSALEADSNLLDKIDSKYQPIIDKAKEYLKRTEDLVDINQRLAKNNYVAQAVSEVYDKTKNSKDEILNGLKSIIDAVSKIGEGFLVAASDAEELGEAFPGILESAEVTAQGKIKLDEEATRLALENKQKEADGSFELLETENRIAQEKLQTQKEELEKELGKVKETNEKIANNDAGTAEVIEESGKILRNKIGDYLKDTQTTDKVVTSVMKLDWNELTQEIAKMPIAVQAAAITSYAEIAESLGILKSEISNSIKQQVAVQDLLGMGILEKIGGEPVKERINTRVGGVNNSGYIQYSVPNGGVVTLSGKEAEALLQYVELKESSGGTIKLTNKLSDNLQKALEEAGIVSTINLKSELEKNSEKMASALPTYDNTPTDYVGIVRQALSERQQTLESTIESIDDQLKSLKDSENFIKQQREISKKYFENAIAGLGGSADADIRKKNLSDPLYNLNSKIKELTDVYDKAVDYYNRIVDDKDSTPEQIMSANEAVNVARRNLANVYNEEANLARSEMKKIASQYSEFRNLLSVDYNSGLLTINNAGIDKLDPDQREMFDEYQSKMENLSSALESAQNEIYNLEKAEIEFTKKWDTSFKSYFNLMQRIQERTEYQEKLQSEYNSLLEKRNISARQLFDIQEKSVNNLLEQDELNRILLQARKNDMKAYLNKNSSYLRYVNYDEEHGTVRIDYDAIKAVRDENLGQKIETITEEITTRADAIKEVEKTLIEIKTSIKEWFTKGRDEYITILGQVRDAIKNSRQNELNKLTAINDSINEANSRLMDAVKENVDKIRQDRQNEKTEKDIAKISSKIGYLSQATDMTTDSKEILDLKKDLESQTQSYSDSLVDQQLSNIQKANETARKQREEQIKLLTQQLEQDEKLGLLTSQAERALETLTKSDGTFNNAAKVLEKLQTTAGYDTLSKVEKMKWLEDIQKSVAQAGAYIRTINQLENQSLKKGTVIQFEDGSGNLLSGTYTGDDDGSVVVTQGNKQYTYDKVYSGEAGKYRTDYGPSSVSTIANEQVKTSPVSRDTRVPETKKVDVKPTDVVTLRSGSKYYPDPSTPTSNGSWDETLDHKVDAINGNRMHLVSLRGGYTSWVDIDSIDKINGIKAYKTGGLVTDTGLAWLDGTRANPEYVLNADITKLMFETISKMQDYQSARKEISNTISKTQNVGDMNVEININVDKIASDYDVTQLTEQIKQELVNESMYRNINAINFLR